jgi:hypothetical protein
VYRAPLGNASRRGSLYECSEGSRRARRLPLASRACLAAAAKKAPAGGSDPVTCRLPESNADSLVILSNFYPGYWWDHTDLTIAVQAHPNARAEQLEAIQAAIATWSETLDECFDGLITLRNVTGAKRKAADIVVHYVPTAGRRRLWRLRDLRSVRTSRPASTASLTTLSTWAG